MNTPTVATTSAEQGNPEQGGPVTYATPVGELMARIVQRAQHDTRDRVENERWGMAYDPEERWADIDAQREFVDYLAGTVATVGDHPGGEVLLTNTGPDAARFGYTLADRLDGAVGNTVVGFPCGEIDQPRAGVARYRHRPTPERVLADGLRFCGTCAVVIANGDLSTDGAEEAAEAIAGRWGERGGHLVVSSAEDDGAEPAWTVFDCDGCARTHHDRPVPGALIRA